MQRTVHPSHLLAAGIAAVCFSQTVSAKLDPTGDWRFQYAIPHGNTYHAMYAASEESAYFGGDGGVIYHWDGSAWTWMSTPTDRNIYAMHGTGDSNVWACGGNDYSLDIEDRSLIMRHDGSSWQTLPNPADTLGQEPIIRGIYSYGPSDTWVVSDLGAVLWHWDGTDWEYVYPNVGTEGSFNTVLGFPGGELYVAGSHGQILHREGGEWFLEQKTQEGFTTDILQALWGTDPDHVYAGGNNGQIYRRESDGTWSNTGVQTSSDHTIWSAWQRSANEVYLIASNNIRYWDMASEPVKTDFAGQFRGQWYGGAGAGDILFGFGPRGVATEYEITSLGQGTLTPLTAGGEISPNIFIKGATSCGPNGILFYGNVHNSQDQMPLFYYDGLSQKPFVVKVPGMGQYGDITAAVATGPDDIIIAWNDYTSGLGVDHWDGENWTSLNGTGARKPSGAFVLQQLPAGVLYAAEQLRIVRWDGSSWTDIVTAAGLDADNTPLFSCFWARSDSDMYAGTTDGRIYHYNGASWSQQTTPEGFDDGITEMIGTDGEVLAFGRNGAAWRNGGGTWTQYSNVETRVGDNFIGACVSGGNIYAIQQTNSSYLGGGLSRIWSMKSGPLVLEAAGISGDLACIAATGGEVVYTLDGYDTVVTNASAGSAPSIRKAALPLDTWTPIGLHGMEIKRVNAEPEKAVIGTARLDRKPEYLEDQFPDSHLAPHQWMAYQDTTSFGTALGEVYLRLPASGPGNLYRHDGTNWLEIEATYAAGKLETNNPVSLSLWAVDQEPGQESSALWMLY